MTTKPQDQEDLFRYIRGELTPEQLYLLYATINWNAQAYFLRHTLRNSVSRDMLAEAAGTTPEKVTERVQALADFLVGASAMEPL
jgi:DNA replication protein DnaD